jgi:uncharacterized membrane protein
MTLAVRREQNCPVMRRRLLWVLLGSIAVNAALGVSALLVPHFGAVQRNVLLTSVCVTAAGIVALACLPAWERRRLMPVPPASFAAAAAGLALGIVMIWAAPADGWPVLGKTMGTLLVLGGAGTLASLLALAVLAPRFRWALVAALALVAAVALVVVVEVWAEVEPPSWAERLYGILAVLAAAFVVAIPVLHRACAREVAALLPVGFCPACGAALLAVAGRPAVCPRCSVGFRADYVERPAAQPASKRLPREEPDSLARARPDRGT